MRGGKRKIDLAIAARMRADGTWRRLYAHWVGKLANTKTPAPPTAQYEH